VVNPLAPEPSHPRHRTEKEDKRHRNWVTVGILAALVVVSLGSLGFAWRADTSSSDAESAAVLAKIAAEAVEQSQTDAACRSVWSAEVVNASAALDDAIARQYALDVNLDILQGEAEESLADGLEGGLLLDDQSAVDDAIARRDSLLDVMDIVVSAIAEVQTEIDLLREVYRDANDAYQTLINAQETDRDEFERLCEVGPGLDVR
jgi:hypothetical protein